MFLAFSLSRNNIDKEENGRLFSSSRCSSLEGFSCSLSKEERELGLIRRESV